MRIIDQSFPAHGRSRLFEVNPHHHLQFPRMTGPQGSELAGVIKRRIHVMNGTGTNDHQQAMVLAPENGLNAIPGCGNSFGGPGIGRQIPVQQGRRNQWPGIHHMQIVSGGHAPSNE